MCCDLAFKSFIIGAFDITTYTKLNNTTGQYYSYDERGGLVYNDGSNSDISAVTKISIDKIYKDHIGNNNKICNKTFGTISSNCSDLILSCLGSNSNNKTDCINNFIKIPHTDLNTGNLELLEPKQQKIIAYRVLTSLGFVGEISYTDGSRKFENKYDDNKIRAILGTGVTDQHVDFIKKLIEILPEVPGSRNLKNTTTTITKLYTTLAPYSQLGGAESIDVMINNIREHANEINSSNTPLNASQNNKIKKLLEKYNQVTEQKKETLQQLTIMRVLIEATKDFKLKILPGDVINELEKRQKEYDRIEQKLNTKISKTNDALRTFEILRMHH
jgi:hypothetical protein